MVKSIIYTLVAAALCAGFFIFTEIYVSQQFSYVYGAAEELYLKVEEGEATASDAEAVSLLWEDKKSKLHVFIPHNDIAQIDYYLTEAGRHIRDGEYGLALSKLEVVKHLALSLPSAYSVRLENVF